MTCGEELTSYCILVLRRNRMTNPKERFATESVASEKVFEGVTSGKGFFVMTG